MQITENHIHISIDPATKKKNMKNQLEQHDAVVAVFAHHRDAEDAVRTLADGGFDMTHTWFRGRNGGIQSNPRVAQSDAH
jgi:hypothetical protein